VLVRKMLSVLNGITVMRHRNSYILGMRVCGGREEGINKYTSKCAWTICTVYINALCEVIKTKYCCYFDVCTVHSLVKFIIHTNKCTIYISNPYNKNQQDALFTFNLFP
jgi:hypothetical protein